MYALKGTDRQLQNKNTKALMYCRCDTSNSGHSWTSMIWRWDCRAWPCCGSLTNASSKLAKVALSSKKVLFWICIFLMMKTSLTLWEYYNDHPLCRHVSVNKRGVIYAQIPWDNYLLMICQCFPQTHLRLGSVSLVRSDTDRWQHWQQYALQPENMKWEQNYILCSFIC